MSGSQFSRFEQLIHYLSQHLSHPRRVRSSSGRPTPGCRRRRLGAPPPSPPRSGCPSWPTRRTGRRCARHDRLASMKPSLVRLLSTTCTPSPPVASRISSPKPVWRLSNMCFTPSDLQVRLLRGAGRWRTPPRPRLAPTGWRPVPTPPARRVNQHAVTLLQSRVLVGERGRDERARNGGQAGRRTCLRGAGATNSSRVTISGANAPNPSPTTWSPTATDETRRNPMSTTYPHISLPRSPSSMKPSERNTSQKLRPAASTATRTSLGSRDAVGKWS